MKRKLLALPVIFCVYCCYGIRPDPEVIRQEFSQICENINCLSGAKEVEEEVTALLQQYLLDTNTIGILERITNQRLGKIPEFFEFQSIILATLRDYKK